ncbi:MAG: carboxypeptidase regulatory-like domain-containing protein [Fibrobacteria bacterium]|nr:carboxypeptidase regulatory-like domain-containing protein [Fibrobacteria bacterium]
MKNQKLSITVFSAFIFHLFIASQGFCQDVFLIGTVKNEQGAPITGANVNLTGQSLSTITDSAGNFKLTNRPIAINKDYGSQQAIQFRGNELNLYFNNSEKVEVALYDIQGCKVKDLIPSNRLPETGNTIYPLPNKYFEMQILYVQTGKTKKIYKIINLSALSINLVNRSIKLGKKSGIVDEIIVEASDYTKKRVTI